jgi:hypothetical protein
LTILGVPWLELRLDDVRDFLEDAGPEPLLWQAKGIKADKGRSVASCARSRTATMAAT